MRKLSHWLEEYPPIESIDICRELAHSHARESGPLGLTILRLIERDDLRGLCEYEVNYSDPGWTAHAVKHARQALAFFQKISDLQIGIDKEKVALQKFLEAELLCSETNKVLSMRRVGDLSFPHRVDSVFHAAQRKIARILGPVPSLSSLDLHFGPGATRGTKRSDASIRRKIAENIACSEDLFPIAAMLLGEMPHLTGVHEDPDFLRIEMSEGVDPYTARPCMVVEEWVSVPVSITPAKLNFVPKNAKTYRSICVEPVLNSMFQLGLGKYMGQRLAAFGIDIRDQSVNQKRALEGSLTGALATLDLSSASDTVSKEIVFELLPLDWATLLVKGRSSRLELPDGSEIVQAKFSSMGNGFTFPLETLIFWSLAASCCDRDSDATVYGDDIIVPSEKYPLLCEVLRYAGFQVNEKKSFSSGPFRESCGKDYFRGIDVRPFYQKGWVSAQSLFVLHNFYVRDLDDDRAKKVESLIHPDLRIYGPDGYGDGHLIGEHPKRKPEKYHRRGFGGYFFDTFTTKQRRDITPIAAGDFVVPLYTIYRRSDSSVEQKYVPASNGMREFLSSSHPPRGADGDSLREVVLNHHFARVGFDASLPLSEIEGIKALTLPGTEGYKKVTIYTLGT